MQDLVILAADKDLEFALKGLLARGKALGIRSLKFDIFVEPEHDPGCALRGVGFLSHFADHYHHGLLIFDHEGSGQEAALRAAKKPRSSSLYRQIGERASLSRCTDEAFLELKDTLIGWFPQ